MIFTAGCNTKVLFSKSYNIKKETSTFKFYSVILCVCIHRQYNKNEKSKEKEGRMKYTEKKEHRLNDKMYSFTKLK